MVTEYKWKIIVTGMRENMNYNYEEGRKEILHNLLIYTILRFSFEL